MTAVQFCAAFARLGGTELGVVRMAGPGLGNMLFPWARALLWARHNGLPLLSPTWPQLKLGPLLRRERDARSYAFQFRPRAGEILGLRRLALLARCAHVDERNRTQKRGVLHAPALRTFEGLEAYFKPLQGEAKYLRAALFDATRSEFHPQLVANPFIAVHVRCGDFSVLAGGPNAAIPAEGLPVAYRAPAGAMVEAVRNARSVLGPLRVRIYSDGTDRELGSLLEIPGIERSSGRAAITELLEMSTARVIIGTPHSTFSMWAAFLGEAILLGFPSSLKRDYGIVPLIETAEPAERCRLLRNTLQEYGK